MGYLNKRACLLVYVSMADRRHHLSEEAYLNPTSSFEEFRRANYLIGYPSSEEKIPHRVVFDLFDKGFGTQCFFIHSKRLTDYLLCLR